MNLYICAREGDAGGYSGRLRDEIARQMPTSRFVDGPSRADIIILLIGLRWVRDATREPSKLLAPGDTVRQLVESVMRDGRRLVPVLIGGARHPVSKDLPASISELVHVNAWSVSHQGFKEDVKTLLAGLVQPAKKPTVKNDAAIELVTTASNVVNWAWENMQYFPVRFVIDGVDRGTVQLVSQTMKVPVEPGMHNVELHSLSVPKQVRSVRVDVRPGETVRVMGSRNWLIGTISLKRLS